MSAIDQIVKSSNAPSAEGAGAQIGVYNGHTVQPTEQERKVLNVLNFLEGVADHRILTALKCVDENAFERFLKLISYASAGEMSVTIVKDKFYQQPSAHFYGKKYSELTPRQQQNVRLYGDCSTEDLFKEAVKVVVEIAFAKNSNMTDVQFNLSLKYFPNENDFIFHLNDIKNATSETIAPPQMYDNYVQALGQLEMYKRDGMDLVCFKGFDIIIMHPQIGELTNMRELRLANRGGTHFPAEIGQLTQLTMLDLCGNPKTIFPIGIINMKNLTYLSLFCFGFQSLPAEISELIQLEKIYIQRCAALISLPPEIGQLSNLTVIDVVENQLTTLPASIGNLPKLAFLWAEKNRFTSMPESVIQIQTLECIGFYSEGYMHNQQLEKARVYLALHGRVPVAKEEFDTIIL